MAKKKTEYPTKYPFWLMVERVTIKAMEFGQLPVLIVGIMFVIIFLRIPPEDLTSILKRTRINDYILSMLLSLFWLFHSKYQRSMYKTEIDRIAKVRNESEKLLTENKLKSSED